MNYLLSQIFLCLLAAFILGAIIGWLWRHITCKKCQDEVLSLHQEIANLKKVQFETKPLSNPPKKQKVKVKKPKVQKPVKVEAPDPVVEVSEVPAFLSAPRNGKADDLKKIKGVGKVLEATLFEKGVYHFDQIANWTDDNAQWMDTFMKFPGRIAREDWRNQAILLAKGDETAFSKKVDKNKLYD